MRKVIVAGRGGNGKTTLVVLLAKRLAKDGFVLVVDSDESNLGLPAVLGLERPKKTLMDAFGGKDRLKVAIRSRHDQTPLFSESLDWSLIPGGVLSVKGRLAFATVGKEEHALEGCPCPMGVLARDFIRALDSTRFWVIVDTEAGVEHFGRGLVAEVDGVIYVAEPAFESLLLFEKVRHMCEEVRKPLLVVANKVLPSLKDRFLQMLKEKGAKQVYLVPYSDDINASNMLGIPIEAEVPEIDSLVEALQGLGRA